MSKTSLPAGMSPGILNTPGLAGRDHLDPYIGRMCSRARSRTLTVVSGTHFYMSMWCMYVCIEHCMVYVCIGDSYILDGCVLERTE
jgi:hypothetical protein